MGIAFCKAVLKATYLTCRGHLATFKADMSYITSSKNIFLVPQGSTITLKFIIPNESKIATVDTILPYHYTALTKGTQEYINSLIAQDEEKINMAVNLQGEIRKQYNVSFWCNLKDVVIIPRKE